MPIDRDLIKQIKDRLDLREIVEEDLGQGKVSGPSVRWCCPFHEGSNPTAFAVTKTKYQCWACEESGDVFTWYMKQFGVNFKAALEQAAEKAGVPVRDNPTPLPPPKPRPIRAAKPPLEPPQPDWQKRGHRYVKRCEAALWNEHNRHALEYLQQRGFTDETIRQAHLGYDPDRKIILIPWYIEDELWRVGARSPEGDHKTPALKGYRQGLYGVDDLEIGKPALLLEGEPDVLIVRQAAGDLIVPVATGGNTSARQTRWVNLLACRSLVLVAFDNDKEGERAAAWWLDVLPNAKRWRPIGAKDPNDMLIKSGADLRAWLGPALGILPEPDSDPETAEETPRWRRWLKKQ